MNLSELFNQRIFRIPDYQRGYAWEDKQLIELWDDVEEILEDNGEYKKHYTGTIYLEKCKPEEHEQWLSGATFYHVVDGQQRLTTISIFIFELLKLASGGYSDESREDLLKTYLRKTNSSGNSTVYRFSYAHTDINYAFLLKSIFEDASCILHDNPMNHYTKNLQQAKEFFASRLRELPFPERAVLFKKLTTALQFDLKTIEQDLDVQEVFETMNNRGKPLSTLEKLKNRLIYLTAKLPDAPEDRRNLRSTINDAWGKIYSCLAKNAASMLDEDVFLSAHLSLYRKPHEAVFSESAAADKVFQMFCNRSDKYAKDDSGDKEPKVSYEKIRDYVIQLSDAAPIWYQIHYSEAIVLKKLQLLNSGKEIKVLLLALLLKGDEAALSEVFTKLEQILFRNRILGFFDERSAATWGRDVYSNEDDVKNIKRKLEELIGLPILTPAVIHAMNNYFTYERGPKGFHRWGALKYFLFDYEELLRERAKETNRKVNIDDFECTTIEHIIPQQWEDNWSQVVNGFSSGLEGERKALALKVLINSLGNLTILKDGKNSSLGKLGWRVKQDRYRTGSYNEIDISMKTVWTEEEILARGIDMLSFLEGRIQGLKMSADEMRKMLFYEDYIIERLRKEAAVVKL